VIPFTEASTVFVVLPDTQLYSLNFPDDLEQQTAFLAHNAASLDIAYVFSPRRHCPQRSLPRQPLRTEIRGVLAAEGILAGSSQNLFHNH
jgi:hypothetical protein